MKSKQYCSVCKEWLDMEVVSGGDPEEDDGVTWYRCPGCQGFLPKLTAGADEGDADPVVWAGASGRGQHAGGEHARSAQSRGRESRTPDQKPASRQS